MLKSAAKEDLDAIYRFCKNDLVGTKISCYCMAYGLDRDFFSAWVNYVDNDLKCVIVKFYDSVSIKATEGCVCDEIKEFCGMLPYNELICDDFTESVLAPGDYSQVKKSYVYRGKANDNRLTDICEDYYKQLYQLVCDNISNSFENSEEAYLSWLSDFTFRKTRNLSRAKGIIKNSVLYSSVLTSSETFDAAVLSAVATSANARGKGFGKSTVMSMVNELLNENKEVYVIALNESAEGFYEHIGFEYVGDIYFHLN